MTNQSLVPAPAPHQRPGRVMGQNFYRELWAPANRASNIAALVTLCAGAVAIFVWPVYWLAVAVIAGFATAFALLFVGRDRRRIIEMVQWAAQEIDRLAVVETQHHRPRTHAEARLWLESEFAQRAPAYARSDALRMLDDLEAARAVLDAAQPANPSERADIEQSRFEADFMEFGSGDMAPWREAIAELHGEEARLHCVDMATYEAIWDHAAGRDWRGRLERTYAEVGPFQLHLGTRALPLINRLILPVVGTAALMAFGLLVVEYLAGRGPF